MKNLPKIVPARLQWPTATAESHPDADLLTAFAERSVAERERVRVVDHLARCADCREVVALALPPEIEAPIVGGTNWFAWPTLRKSVPRWALVAAGILVIASFGTVQYRRQHAGTLASNILESASGRTLSEPVAPQTSTQSTRSLPEMSAAPSDQRSTAKPPVAGPRFPAGAAKKSRPANTLSVPQSEAASSNATGSSLTQSTPDESTTNQAMTNQATVDSAQVDQREEVAKAKPAFEQAAPSTLAPAPSLRAGPSLMPSRSAPRWAISTTGALQRSVDGGKTWLDMDAEAESEAEAEAKISTQSAAAKPAAPQSLPASTIFRALSVASSTPAVEVWAGASGGALYHTVDGGARWARVLPSAAGVALTGDVIGIQFSDPRNGTVTTSNAEVWITIDGGQTWRKQQ
jgi:hypothetical protein